MRLIDADALLGIFNGLLLENVYEQKMIEHIIKHAPTVEPQQWIPVTERLPEKGKLVLVSQIDRVVCTNWLVRNCEGNLEWMSYHKDVVAWMPLPEPFRGGEE